MAAGVTLVVPFAACVPLQPPEAVHDVALVDDQVSVLGEPEATVIGLALIETVGAGVPGPVLPPLSPPPPQAASATQAVERTSSRSEWNMGTARAPGQARE